MNNAKFHLLEFDDYMISMISELQYLEQVESIHCHLQISWFSSLH